MSPPPNPLGYRCPSGVKVLSDEGHPLLNIFHSLVATLRIAADKGLDAVPGVTVEFTRLHTTLSSGNDIEARTEGALSVKSPEATMFLRGFSAVDNPPLIIVPPALVTLVSLFQDLVTKLLHGIKLFVFL